MQLSRFRILCIFFFSNFFPASEKSFLWKFENSIMLKSRNRNGKFRTSKMAAPPTKTLTATGPVIIVILIISAALLGYYQIVYYPTVAPTSTTTLINVPPTKLNVTVVMPSGASSSGKLTSFYYSPDSITVQAGVNSTVIWKNEDGALHTVTAAVNSPDPRFNAFGPTSPQSSWNNVQPNGGEVNFTFTIPGTYNYTCSYHNWMHGQVIVLPGSPSSNSSTTIAHSTSAAMISRGHSFWSGAMVFASSLATRIGSGLDPWRVNLSSHLFELFSFIPAVLTKTT
jgi:plastocyanin